MFAPQPSLATDLEELDIAGPVLGTRHMVMFLREHTILSKTQLDCLTMHPECFPISTSIRHLPSLKQFLMGEMRVRSFFHCIDPPGGERAEMLTEFIFNGGEWPELLGWIFGPSEQAGEWRVKAAPPDP